MIILVGGVEIDIILKSCCSQNETFVNIITAKKCFLQSYVVLPDDHLGKAAALPALPMITPLVF